MSRTAMPEVPALAYERAVSRADTPCAAGDVDFLPERLKWKGLMAS